MPAETHTDAFFYNPNPRHTREQRQEEQPARVPYKLGDVVIVRACRDNRTPDPYSSTLQTTDGDVQTTDGDGKPTYRSVEAWSASQ